MICPRCQTANPANARFCLHCGNALGNACPHCGTPVPADAKFCLNCGRSLEATTTNSLVQTAITSPADPASALENQLLDLQRADLIREAARLPDWEFAFRHALTQDVVYQSMLLNQRRAFHRHVGETLEQLTAERLDENAALLAHHFYEAQDARSLRYDTLAADAAARLHANAEAVAHYTRAIEVAQRELGAGREAPLQDLFVRRGRALELQDQYADAIANYEAMRDWALAHADRHMQLAALMALGTVYALPSASTDHARVRALCADALTLARALGDERAEAKILWNLMINARGTTDFADAVQYGEESLAIARRLGWREQMAYTLNDLSEIYSFMARTQRAREVLEEASQLWRELNNLPLLADNLSRISALQTWVGEYAVSIATAQEARHISERIHNVWGQAFSEMFVGRAYLELGRAGDAIAAMERAIQLSEQGSFVAPQALTRAELALLYGQLGQTAHGIELAQRAVASAAQWFELFGPVTLGALAHLHQLNGDLATAESILESNPQAQRLALTNPIFNARFTLTVSELRIEKGQYAQALDLADSLIETHQRFAIRTFLLSAQHVRAQALRGLGRMAEAYETLRAAHAEGERLGARWSLWAILKTLSEVENERGEHAEEQSLRRQAQAIVAALSEHMPEALRASFQATSVVRALFADFA